MSHSIEPVVLVERRGGHVMHAPTEELLYVPMSQSACVCVCVYVCVFVCVVELWTRLC